MCGIAGIFRFDGRPVEQDQLDRMSRAIAHRGPDDDGIIVDGNVGLAHRRLSILDLSQAGHQPMLDEQTGNWIIYNGEIYNFKEIRLLLEEKGCQFRSTSDTEVILYAYRQWGMDCLERFNGMFAFAIFDASRRELFLARDRMGIKPLYYFTDNRQFVFASETKAVVLVDDVPRTLNRDALPELLAFRYLTAGQTLLEGVREVEPGHYLMVDAKGICERQYWDIPCQSVSSVDRAWSDEFEERLQKSINYRLIADVPVGCALSGGIDSSLVTSMANEAATSTMKTFSVGFDLPQYDERPFAREVAESLGVHNDNIVLDEESFYGHLAQLVWQMDEPMNHPNSIGIWMLAKLARQQVTVLMSGEGGDELLAGYWRFRTVSRLRRLRRMAPGSRAVAKLLPGSLTGKLGFLARQLAQDDDGMMIWSSAYMSHHMLDSLVGSGAAEKAVERRRQVLARAKGAGLLNQHLYYELKTYLVSSLNRVDKMGMAHGLECRVPLLDHTLVEYAMGLPDQLKCDKYEGKQIARTLLRRRFDDQMYDRLFNRNKIGFGLPQPYFQGEGLKYLDDIITSQSFRERELVDPSVVRSIVQQQRGGQEDLTGAIWLMATLELWARAFLDRPAEVAA